MHTEEAFWTCEQADTDALARARQKIIELDGEQVLGGSENMKNASGVDAGQESDESLAARFEITFDGKRYTFRQYQYDRFDDALRYSVAEHAKTGFLRDESFQPCWKAAYHPTDEDNVMMKLHGIAYVEGHYFYGGNRYGQLCDAVAFAAVHPNLYTLNVTPT